MPASAFRSARIALAGLLPLLAGACATSSAADGSQNVVDASPRLLLLGEVHDNAEGHRLRLEQLQRMANGGADMAIAMEQFDRERQADLDAAVARCSDAACVIAAAAPANAGWNWDFYAPVIQLALDHDVPLIAANLSRADAAKVMRDGFAALPERVHAAHLERPLPQGVLAAQVEAVRIGHCGLLPETLLEPMARAQIARDVVMADAMLGALQHHQQVVLLAGNGHVDRRIGVPFWLDGSGERWQVTGFVEQRGDEVASAQASAYDRVHHVAPVDRGDPCAQVKPPSNPAP